MNSDLLLIAVFVAVACFYLVWQGYRAMHNNIKSEGTCGKCGCSEKAS